MAIVKIKNPQNVTLISKEMVDDLNNESRKGWHGTFSKYSNPEIGSKIKIIAQNYGATPQQQEFDLHATDPRLIRLKDAYVNWQMFVFDNEKKLVQENLNTFFEWDNGMVPTSIYKSPLQEFLLKFSSASLENKFIARKKTAFKKYAKQVFASHKKIEEIENAIIFCDQYWYVFGHFISEQYPRLHFALKNLSAEEKAQIKIILPPKKNYHTPDHNSHHFNFIEPIIAGLGIKEEQKIYLESDKLLKIKNLVLPSPIRFHEATKDALRDLVAFYDDGKNYPEFEKIYLSRKKAPRRKMANEEEVENVLSQLGFKSVVIEEHDFKTQINILKNAKIMVAQDSSSLTNVILAQNCQDCLVLTCEKATCPFFSTMVDSRFHYLFCDAEDPQNFDWYSSNIIANPEKLKNEVQKILQNYEQK